MIEIPEPICKADGCGKKIPRKGNESISHWLRRKTCWDNNECRKKAMVRTVGDWREKNPDYWKKEAEQRKVEHATRSAVIGRKKFREPDDVFDMQIFQPWVPRAKVPQEEHDRMEEEQRKIDKAVDERLKIKSGMTGDTGRRLSKSEIAAIAHTITYIGDIPFITSQESVSSLYREVC